MDENKFSALMVLIVPQIVSLISSRYSCDELTASDEFYRSKVYALLEQEDTKVWHFSPLTILNMFDEEKKTGEFVIPEEG